MMLVPFIYAAYIVIIGTLIHRLLAIAIMIFIPLIVYFANDFIKRGDRSGWVEYDTIRVSVPPGELVRLLSDILKRANIPHEVLEMPLGDGYTSGSSFALWIPADNIGMWLADHGPMKSLPSVRVALGKKTGNNGPIISKYKEIIDTGLEKAGFKLYDPPMA